MNKIIALLFLVTNMGSSDIKSDQIITRQGQVSFFSYTSVENIEAKNNQVLSIIDLSKNEIAISMLMNAFVFKKSLMHEHFNESYIESDLYPKATFKGEILDYDPEIKGVQTKFVKGTLTIRDIEKEVEIKTSIENIDGKHVITGDFEVVVKDFEIKIPPILRPNIAEVISIKFRFEYQPYEK
ncbi:YceI family protein [Aquimarina sp. AD1]|uniref:YceI family protein n=1 Tax=unclassified Aquimarina TaxID=2627091 RepID=UPI000D558034|nr:MULTISPECIES: YceI family protein [unclassified Aquimarina]AXT55120.1 YceI family protein [Aquimarina sp. AD1]RKN05058.1 YceI family protein [Aquimarina sp. AD1]